MIVEKTIGLSAIIEDCDVGKDVDVDEEERRRTLVVVVTQQHDVFCTSIVGRSSTGFGSSSTNLFFGTSIVGRSQQ